MTIDKESLYYETVSRAAYHVWRDAISEKDSDYQVPLAIEDQTERYFPEAAHWVLQESPSLNVLFEQQGFVTGLSWTDTARQVCRAAFTADITEVLEENRATWDHAQSPERLTSEEDIVHALVMYGIPDEQLEGRETEDIIEELIENLASDGYIDSYRSEDYYRAHNACQQFLSQQ